MFTYTSRSGEERLSVFTHFLKPNMGNAHKILWSGVVTSKSGKDQCYVVRARFQSLNLAEVFCLYNILPTKGVMQQQVTLEKIHQL